MFNYLIILKSYAHAAKGIFAYRSLHAGSQSALLRLQLLLPIAARALYELVHEIVGADEVDDAPRRVRLKRLMAIDLQDVFHGFLP